MLWLSQPCASCKLCTRTRIPTENIVSFARKTNASGEDAARYLCIGATATVACDRICGFPMR